MAAKKSRLACDGRLLKANSNNQFALYSEFASKSQAPIDALRVAHLARRFGLAPHLAATIAEHAFLTGRAR
jgi:hypothetical protein